MPPTINGYFIGLRLPDLGPGLAWDISQLPVNGSISVYAAAKPVIAQMAVTNPGGFTLNGTGAAGQKYVLLMTSNLLSPINWIAISTNIADGNGVFSFTDTQAANSLQRFYRIQQAP